MAGLDCVTKYEGGMPLWLTDSIMTNWKFGPYAAASGAHYDACSPADLTVPAGKVLYVPYLQIGPPPAVNSQNDIFWMIYSNNVCWVTGKASDAPIPINLYAPPGSKVKFFSRIMATDAGITPTLHVSLPQWFFDATKGWAWDTVVGVANPAAPAGLPWP